MTIEEKEKKYKIEVMRVMAQVYCAALQASNAPNIGIKMIHAKEAVDDFLGKVDKEIK